MFRDDDAGLHKGVIALTRLVVVENHWWERPPSLKSDITHTTPVKGLTVNPLETPIMRRILLSAIAVVALLADTTGAEVLLIADGQPQAVVVLPAKPSVAARDAAVVLNGHFHQIAGARLPVVHEDQTRLAVQDGRVVSRDDDRDVSYVFVGEGELTRTLGADAGELGPGGILIRTVGNALVILGPDDRTPDDPWGTMYAATEFLERELNVRYLWPGEMGKVVPKQKAIRVSDLDISLTPHLKQREIRSSGYFGRIQEGLDWLGFTKEQFNEGRDRAMATRASSPNWFRWHRLGGRTGLVWGHAFGHLWQKYSEAHPEWFAMRPDGSRDQSKRPERARLCVSNPGLIETIARETIEKLDSKKGLKAASICPNDGSYTTFCVCAECRALDHRDGRAILLRDESTGTRMYFEYNSLSDRYVSFFNRIAEKVTAVHPDALLSFYAYSAYCAPPIAQKPHPSLIAVYTGIQYLDENARQQGLADWDGWSALGVRMAWRPNLLNAGWHEGTPVIYVHKLAEDFRYMAHHGLIATDFDTCNHNWATQGLNYYVTARLNWDPDLDVDAVVDDYCRSGFGPGWTHVRRYFDRVEQITEGISRDVSKREFTLEGLAAAMLSPGIPLTVGVSEPYTPEVVAELRSCLEDAASMAGDDQVVHQRVAFLRRGLDFTELQGQIYRLLRKARQEPLNADEKRTVKETLDRKWLMMRQIFDEAPLAVNVAYVGEREMGRWLKPIGGSGPSDEARARVSAATP